MIEVEKMETSEVFSGTYSEALNVIARHFSVPVGEIRNEIARFYKVRGVRISLEDDRKTTVTAVEGENGKVKLEFQFNLPDGRKTNPLELGLENIRVMDNVTKEMVDRAKVLARKMEERLTGMTSKSYGANETGHTLRVHNTRLSEPRR